MATQQNFNVRSDPWPSTILLHIPSARREVLACGDAGCEVQGVRVQGFRIYRNLFIIGIYLNHNKNPYLNIYMFRF